MLAPLKYITHHTEPFHRLTMVVLSLFAVTLLLIGLTIPDTPAWLIVAIALRTDLLSRHVGLFAVVQIEWLPLTPAQNSLTCTGA